MPGSEGPDTEDQRGWDWERLEEVMQKLMADGYDVDDVITSTSIAEADDKMLQVVFSRE